MSISELIYLRDLFKEISEGVDNGVLEETENAIELLDAHIEKLQEAECAGELLDE